MAREYVTFKDGHEEDIVYLEDGNDLGVLFATKSGVYCFTPEKSNLRGTYVITTPNQFQRVHLDANIRAEDIESVTIDRRISYEYEVDGGGVYIRGKILVPPDYNDEKIRKLIMEDLHIKYRKE